MKNLIGLLLFLCIGYGSAQAQSSAPAPADLARLFDYDAAAPLDVKEVSTRTIDGAQVKDITFASPKGGRVTAFLVTPVKGAGRGPAPATREDET